MGRSRTKIAVRAKRAMAAGLVGCLLYGGCVQASALVPEGIKSAVQADGGMSDDAFDAMAYGDLEAALGHDGDSVWNLMEGNGTGEAVSAGAENSAGEDSSTEKAVAAEDEGIAEKKTAAEEEVSAEKEVGAEEEGSAEKETGAEEKEVGAEEEGSAEKETGADEEGGAEEGAVTGEEDGADGSARESREAETGTPEINEGSIGAKAWEFVNNQNASYRGDAPDYTHIYIGSGYTSYKLDFGDGGFRELVLTGDFIGDCNLELHLGSSEGELVSAVSFRGGNDWNDSIIQTNTVTAEVPELADVTGEQEIYFVFKNGNYNFASFCFNRKQGEDNTPGGEEEGIGAKASQFSENGGVRNDGTHIYASDGNYVGYELDFGDGGFNELTLTGDFINNCNLEVRLGGSDGQLVKTVSFTGGSNWNDAQIQTNTLTFKAPELAGLTGEQKIFFVFKRGSYNFASFRIYRKPAAGTLKVEAESYKSGEGVSVEGDHIGGMKDKAWALYSVDLGEGGYNQISIRYGAGSPGGTVRFYLGDENYKESGRLLGEKKFEGTGGWDMNATVACYVPGLTEETGEASLVIEWESPNGDYLMNPDYFELSADGLPEEEPSEPEQPSEPPAEEREGGLKVEAESCIKREGAGLEGDHLGGLKEKAWAMYRVDLGTGGYNQISLRYGADTMGGIVRLWLGDFETMLGETEFEGTGSWDMNSIVTWDVPELAAETGYVYLVMEWKSPEGESDWLMNPDYFKLYRDEEPDEGDEPGNDDESILKIEFEDLEKGEGITVEGDHLGGIKGHGWAMYNVDLAEGGYNQITVRYGAISSGGIVRLWLGDENYKESGRLLGETTFWATGGWDAYQKITFYAGDLAEVTGEAGLVIEWESPDGDYLMNPDYFELSKDGKAPEVNEDTLTIQEKAEQGFSSFIDAYYIKSRYDEKAGRFNGANFWDTAEMFEIVIDAYEHTEEQKYLDMIYEIFQGFLSDRGNDWSGNEFNDDIAWMTIACARAYINTGSQEFLDIAVKHFDIVWNRGWSDDLGGGIWWKTDNNTKNACVNCPMAIAACLLGEATGEEGYYEKARQIMEWVAANIYEEDTGHVYDSYNISGEKSKWASTYNQGTFIGANTLLYEHYDEAIYYTRARKAADYTINDMFKGGVMNSEGSTDDLVGFKGILARWMHCFNEKCGEPDVMSWLRINAESAWKNRNSYGLMRTEFGIRTWDDANITAFNASSAVSALFNCWPCRAGVSVNKPDTSEKPEYTVKDETDSDVKADITGLADLSEKLKSLGINPQTQSVEVILSQMEPSESESDRLKEEIEKGYTFAASFDINMAVYVYGIKVADITEGFGSIKLSIRVGAEYTGREAVVYHLHNDEVLSYKGITVDEEGYVQFTVDKLSVFAVALKDDETSTEPTETPAEPTENPVEPTETPAEPTENPVEPTETPAEPTENPVEPTETPAEPTENPVEPTEMPAEPTENPVEPTETPAEPTENPVEPTETPTGGTADDDQQPTSPSGSNGETDSSGSSANAADEGLKVSSPKTGDTSIEYGWDFMSAAGRAAAVLAVAVLAAVMLIRYRRKILDALKE